MHFSYACTWDKGDFYTVNQDSFALQAVLTGSGPYAMALVCDGVGGLSRGEYASGITAKAMTAWFYEHALEHLCKNISYRRLFYSFRRALCDVHRLLEREGKEQGLLMGTTITMLLLCPHDYYVFHVGDCRCYRVGRKVSLLTTDQTGVGGKLLYAVGVGEMPVVTRRRGRYGRRDTFLLCSDGFARSLNMQALHALGANCDKEQAEKRKLMQEIVARGRKRGEKDNCTGIVLRRK